MFPKVALFEACWSDFVKVSIPGPPESETREIGSAFLQAQNSYRNQVQCTLLGACTLGEGAQGAGRETLFPFVILK